MNDPLQEEIDAAILEVVHSGKFILGDYVMKFEDELRDYLGREYAVGTSCGTDSLYLALQAAGVGKGDTVMAPAFTLTASVSGITRLGASPVFLDVDTESYTLDPKVLWRYLERAQNTPKALIVVHLYGQSADMDPIMDICNHFNVAVIEDCCEALSALYPSRHGTVKVGKMGLMSCFSFFPTKPLGGMGDGGAIVTDDPDLDLRLRQLRQHGWDMSDKYVNREVGINSRLDAIQAAVLSVKLPYVDRWTGDVQRLAKCYDENLSVGVPFTPYGFKSHCYHLYTIRVTDPGLLKCDLKRAGIASDVYFPVTMPRQPAFVDSGFNRYAPMSDALTKEILSIPLFYGMTAEEQKYVIDKVNEHV
jgi:dTDP-4-amino-4,6-dideoxygalactose transaminase